MQAGLMRSIVSIQDPTESIDGTGLRSYDYSTTEAKVWARVRNVSQSVGMEGEVQKAGQASYEVRMRWRSGITYETRIGYGDLTLQIRGIETILERHHASGEIRLDCEVAEL